MYNVLAIVIVESDIILFLQIASSESVQNSKITCSYTEL